MVSRVEEGLRDRSHQYALLAETVLQAGVAILLAGGAAAALIGAGLSVWRGLGQNTIPTQVVSVLDQLLLTLIFVEVLHTVRISIRSEQLLTEPFLIVGLIASVRRVLLITMQQAQITQQGDMSAGAQLVLRNSMIELALLGFLILVFVLAIYILRRRPPIAEAGAFAPRNL